MDISYLKQIFVYFLRFFYGFGFLLDRTPTTCCLYSIIITVHLNPEKSRFTPIAPPIITSNPILNSILDSPTYNRYFVVEFWGEIYLSENPTCVLMELGCGFKGTSYRSSCVNFSLHFISSRNCSIF